MISDGVHDVAAFLRPRHRRAPWGLDSRRQPVSGFRFARGTPTSTASHGEVDRVARTEAVAGHGAAAFEPPATMGQPRGRARLGAGIDYASLAAQLMAQRDSKQEALYSMEKRVLAPAADGA